MSHTRRWIQANTIIVLAVMGFAFLKVAASGVALFRPGLGDGASSCPFGSFGLHGG